MATRAPSTEQLPWTALILLASVGFLLVAAETLPAGLLPVMSADLRVGEGTVGQLVSVWALGTVVVTAPAIRWTQHLRRKPLLLGALVGVIVANTLTAVVGEVWLLLVTRFVAGGFTGMIWAMVAGYSRRISPPRRAGVALAVAYAGSPIGFALGTPLGTWLGTAAGWRWAFAGISALALLVGLLMVVRLPDAGRPPEVPRVPLRTVFLLPGVRAALLVLVFWALAHTTLYTYVAPYLRASGTGLRTEMVLFVYGVAAVLGVVLAAVFLDRFPGPLLHGTTAVFTAAGLALLVGHRSAVVVVVATVVWGITYGSAAAQIQSALARAGREHADVANAFLPVGFNVAIAAAGGLGAILLTGFDGLVLAAVMALLGAAAFGTTLAGRRTTVADG